MSITVQHRVGKVTVTVTGGFTKGHAGSDFEPGEPPEVYWEKILVDGVECQESAFDDVMASIVGTDNVQAVIDAIDDALEAAELAASEKDEDGGVREAAVALRASSDGEHRTHVASGWRLRSLRYGGRFLLGAVLEPYGRASTEADYEWVGRLVAELGSADATPASAVDKQHPNEPIFWDWAVDPGAGPAKPLPRPGAAAEGLPPAWTSEPWAEPAYGIYGARYRHPNGAIVTCSEGPLVIGVPIRIRHVAVSGAANDAACDALAKRFLMPHRYHTSPRFGRVRHYHQIVRPPFQDDPPWSPACSAARA